MAKLIYFLNTSLDGHIEDGNGDITWAIAGDEEFSFISQIVASTGTFLYGRRMYETMAYWETAKEEVELRRTFAEHWQDKEKIVYSTTLGAPKSARTRIERTFDPVAVGRLKAAADRDMLIGGPELASHAMRTDLVDELQMLLHPVVLGSGKPLFPHGVRLDLDLVEQRPFRSGAIFFRYTVKMDQRTAQS